MEYPSLYLYFLIRPLQNSLNLKLHATPIKSKKDTSNEISPDLSILIDIIIHCQKSMTGFGAVFLVLIECVRNNTHKKFVYTYMFMYGGYENERKSLKRNAEFRVILWHSMTFKMRPLPIHNSIYQITYLKLNQKYLKKTRVKK